MAKPDVLLDLARKMSSDPAIQRQIAEAFFQLTTSNPQLGRRLLDGDPQAVLEAYQTLIRNNGNIPMPSGPPRIGASPIGPGQTVGGVSGPGVPVNPGTGLIPAPPRGLPNDPSATRQLTTTGGDAPDALDSAAREITVIDAKPTRDSDGFWSDDAETIWRDGVLDEVDEADNVVIEGGPNTDLTVPQYAPASRGPLPPENPFTPAVSTRPRLGHSPAGPGVPVGGPAGGPRGLVPAGPRRPEVPGWVPYAATAGVVGGLGGAIYMGTRPGEAPAPGVAADLDAAATEIAPDAAVKDTAAKPSPRDSYHARLVAAGYTPEQADQIIAFESTQAGGLRPQDVTDEALASKAARSNAAHNRWDAQAGPRLTREDLRRQADAEVRAKGSPANYADTGLHTDYRSPYGPMNNFAEGAMVTVDGVQVPGFDLGDGRLRYRLGDVKAAQEAAHNAKLDAMFSQSAQEDLAAYGTRQLFQYKRDDAGNLSPGRGTAIPTDGDLQDPNSDNKKYPSLSAAEKDQQDRLAKRRDMEYRQVEQSAMLRNRPGLRALKAKEAERADRFSDMARLAGGSQGLRGGAGGNIGMFQALAMLEGVDPNSMDARHRNLMYAAPGGQGVAAVDAAGAQNAMRMIQPILTAGAGGALGLFGQRDPMLARDMQRMDALRLAAGQAYTGAMYASGRRRAVNDALIRAGASAAERARLMEEYFGSEPPADVPAPPPLAEVDAGAMPQVSL